MGMWAAVEGVGAGGRVWQQAAVHAALHGLEGAGAPVLLSGGESRHGVRSSKARQGLGAGASGSPPA